MLYGQRLAQAIAHREHVIGRDIPRIELAKVAGCTRQNIGMILTNAKQMDQRLSTESHAAVAAYLRVNPDWLLSGVGEMLPRAPASLPSALTPGAVEIAVLYDMIPEIDKISRAKAFNAATTAIMVVLQALHATPPATPL